MESREVQTKHSKKSTLQSKFIDVILPVTGCVSYECFAVNIMNPKRFQEFFGDKTFVTADILWFNAHIGFGVYLYRQRFLQKASTHWKITYSVFVSALFNFGSVLLWGSSKKLLPTLPERIKVIFGLGSGLLLMYIGWHFSDFLNKQMLQQREH
ncbi:uncharacterized protein LOC132737961 [Ruditapes philippinarum]|uniref:uncharacterized protein LOC132737961 n=1 Tax=Ruditapes philippinarum TaxID=129788 RepID=UPI00295B87D7|nr:uncharacterized protein LOC132737961 [Ruditapes philippinarum]